MFCRPRFLGLLLLFAAAGCGHKAPPFPPPLANPARTEDLSVQQRGQAAVLSFTYPRTTVSGGVLGELTRVEVFRTKKALSGFLGEDPSAEEAKPEDSSDPTGDSQDDEAEAAAKEPEVGPDEELGEDPAGDSETDSETSAEEEPDLPEEPLEILAAADPNEFLATAHLLETLNTASIEEATDGDKLTIRLDLADASHEEWAHTFAIKTYTSEKLVSAFSNLVTLAQRIPPPPPTDFQLIAEAAGVRLTWAAAPESEDPPTGIRVYRRPAQSRLYGEPLTRLPGDSTEYIDSTAAFGERYIYAVTALGNENPIVESFFGGEREIDYADRFAPAPPANLIALAESGRVRLLWDASIEDDVVGYVVFRRQAGADFRRLTEEPILNVEYSDRTVESGTTYDYRISAVDRVGNQGEPSSSVIARVP